MRLRYHSYFGKCLRTHEPLRPRLGGVTPPTPIPVRVIRLDRRNCQSGQKWPTW